MMPKHWLINIIMGKKVQFASRNKIVFMKKNLCIILFTLILFVSSKVLAQNNTKLDTIEKQQLDFSLCLVQSVYEVLNKVDLGTENIMANYAFKFSISDSNTLVNYEANRATPKWIADTLRHAFHNGIGKAVAKKVNIKLFQPDDLLVPLILIYYPNDTAAKPSGVPYIDAVSQYCFSSLITKNDRIPINHTLWNVPFKCLNLCPIVFQKPWKGESFR